MEALSPLSSREDRLKDSQISHERLGFNPNDASLFTDASPNEPWILWGFPAEVLDPTRGIPDPADKSKMITGGRWTTVLAGRVDVFLRQSGFNYRQLLNLIQFSNLFGAIEPTLSIRAQEGVDVDTCKL